MQATPPAIVTPAPVVAGLPFAPPKLLRYRTVQTRAAAAGPIHFTMERSLAFAPLPGGHWRATLTLTAMSSDAHEPVRGTFLVGMTPFLHVPVRIDLDPRGQVVAVLDAERTWGRIAASFAAVLADMEKRKTPEPFLSQFRAFVAQQTGLPPADREARLAETIEPFLARALPALKDGETAPYAAIRPSPLGTKLATSGTVRRAAGPDGTALYDFDLAEDSAALGSAAKAAGAAPARPTMRQRISAAASRTTGMLVRQRIVTTIGLPGRSVEMTEETAQIP
ncbi:hypothetical protein PQ455_12250 [Sphingomonas naphthae]|uniref:Uncharacterized protein n=1 Tax=Sphingomonas naphthae TaxID=1813468 RepID=A0ABY7TGP9_9SPHN|nr:hypothetical protein [Sphingomonas naphthae]WCT72407.1 hypothetical protein PQ455_12250 [Sphingomonas naphthae]